MLDPFSPVPMRSLTVKGMGLPAAIPATRRASFWGLRSRTAPSPRLVASAEHKRWTCKVRADCICAAEVHPDPVCCLCTAQALNL